MLFRSLKGKLKDILANDYLNDKEYYNAIILHIFSRESESCPQNISNLII